MTRDEICKIVCRCLGEITIAPPNTTQQACEDQSTGGLGLSDQDIDSLFECIHEKLHERGKAWLVRVH